MSTKVTQSCMTSPNRPVVGVPIDTRGRAAGPATASDQLGGAPIHACGATWGRSLGGAQVYGCSVPSGDIAPNPDPNTVHTLTELAVALNALRGARSYRELTETAKKQPSRGGRRPVLPRATLSDLMNGKSVPSRETMVSFLSACGLDAGAQQAWLAAWERVSTSHLRRPAGAVRLGDARPRLLGVHASIQVEPGVDTLPAYVPRDFDLDLRTAITAAAANGGFLLLRGGSSVGKTRASFEAVRSVLADWWLLHPADTADVRAFAESPTPRTVVWLDELQRYLNDRGGLPVGSVRTLIAAGVVVMATLWPDEYGKRAVPRTPGEPDPYSNDRELLHLARAIDVPHTFSSAERRRAEELAADKRIRVALDTTDAGFTQVLAAGPELVRWWEHADIADPAQCFGTAVITAALDARRVGAEAPLTAEFLVAAAPAYLTPAQRAISPADWFEKAIGYATTRLHGATGCLSPIAAEMAMVDGWVTADYLYQHARQVRRTEVVPDQVWQSIVAHHTKDSVTLAENAQRRGRPDLAIVFYRRIDTREMTRVGNEAAVISFLGLLARHGHVEELRQRAAAGFPLTEGILAAVLANQGALGELRQHAAIAGDPTAAVMLADVLAEQGRTDEAIALLRQRIDAGDDLGYALADLLEKANRGDEAIAILREQVAGGDDSVIFRMVNLLTKNGKIDEALAALQQQVDRGDNFAAVNLARLMTEQGRTDVALALLRQHAESDHGYVAFHFVELLAKLGHIDELRLRADSGDTYAAVRLAELLVKEGRVGELCQRADDGDARAAGDLAGLLFDQDQADEAIALLQRHAESADCDTAVYFADLLAVHGSVDEAVALMQPRADAGDESAESQLAHLLAKQGAVAELRRRADAGSSAAARWLVDLLTEQGRLDELALEVAAGTPGAAERLAEIQSSENGSRPPAS